MTNASVNTSAIETVVPTTVFPPMANARSLAERALRLSAQIWFLVAVAGQWIFLYYIIAFYGGAALEGGAAGESAGIIAGDALGNLALGAHILLSVIIFVGGPLQLIPQVRTRLPRFHRLNGRVYLLSALVTSLAGLYLIWTRDIPGGLLMDIAISIDALLILAFGALALRRALARDLASHRRWALRLFMAVSAVWFFRIGFMFWMAINQGPVGIDLETFTGPAVTFIAFAQYLLPLAALEAYFFARDRADASVKLITASGILVLTLAMGFGIIAATMGMWLPRL